MIEKYAEKILKLYNYIDGLVMSDEKGYIVYFTTYRPEYNNLREDEVLGKHILDIYPTLTEKTSSIMRVIKNKKPIYNETQKLKTFKGQSLKKINTTLPIIVEDKFKGVVEVSRYMDNNIKKKNILLSLKEKQYKKNNTNLYGLDDIITCEESMKIIKKKITKISKTKSSVLIYGETGTGKELVAQAIHNHSIRAKKPFVSQNCAAIPSTLLESILFGTVKGSYTGAEDRKGLFELAQGGTLFLDEINSMEIGVQAKLLKAIEDKVIRKIGGLKAIKTDVRIISAVNEPPSDSIEKNKLRRDLFHRLGVVQINLPPLRNRKKDINYLTKAFIDKYNEKMGRNITGIDNEVEELFNIYSWPGNVRELQNAIEGAFNLASNSLITIKDLPHYLSQKNSSEMYNYKNLGQRSLKDMVENYEKMLINEALKKEKNKIEAARLLKISKQLLNYKMKKYNLS